MIKFKLNFIYMKIIHNLNETFYKEFHRWPLWVPILFGCGISIYYSLHREPSLIWAYIGIFFFGLSVFIMVIRKKALLILAIGIVAFGFSIGSYRTKHLNTEMLQYPLAPMDIKGTVIQVELKPNKQEGYYQKLILRDIQANTQEKLPNKIRVSMKGKRERLWPGQVIRMKVKLNPIPEPSLPGEFDFRRQTYFNGIGATGFALSPPEVIGSHETLKTKFEKKREELTAYFIDHMKAPHGAIAAALITGDKAGIPDDVREDFVQSGLAHILAISGLHLSIIAGGVFVVFRKSIALFPPLCLRYSSKKIAAIGTIFVTLLYLILSGFGVPAQRAFIMISVVMGAILIDRTALSIRTVALAAFLILLFCPESLLGPSFQLSFAAVTVLISGYEALKNPLANWVVGGGIFRKLIAYSGGVAFTSLLATLATLPFTIYLFHRFSLHAIEANLVAVPLTTLFVMPSALLTCVTLSLGCESYFLMSFEYSLDLLIAVAREVSSWPGANIWVARPPLSAFILFVVGGLWLCLWQQRWRRWGFIPMAVGAMLAFQTDLPQILIDGQGKLVGIFNDGSLHLSSNRKAKFTAESWKKYIAARDVKPMACKDGLCQQQDLDIPLYVSYDKENQPCIKDALIVDLEPLQKACPEAFHTIDWYDIWREGGLALWLKDGELRIKSVRSIQGQRPWTRRAIHRRDRPTIN